MLIVRPMPKKELVDCLKRTAETIWKENGVVRKIEFLYTQKLPYAAKGPEEGNRHKEGSYFLYHISLPTLKLGVVSPEFKLDLDVVRATFNAANETALPEDYKCTLEEELQTPFFRKSVQPLLENKNVRLESHSVTRLFRKREKKDLVI